MSKNRFFKKAMVLASPLIALPLYLWSEIEEAKGRGKVKELVYETNVLLSSGTMLPHIKKKAKGGEDAYVISPDLSMVAMADGVGGWNRKGIDPALFSNELVKHYLANY